MSSFINALSGYFSPSLAPHTEECKCADRSSGGWMPGTWIASSCKSVGGVIYHHAIAINNEYIIEANKKDKNWSISIVNLSRNNDESKEEKKDDTTKAELEDNVWTVVKQPASIEEGIKVVLRALNDIGKKKEELNFGIIKNNCEYFAYKWFYNEEPDLTAMNQSKGLAIGGMLSFICGIGAVFKDIAANGNEALKKVNQLLADLIENSEKYNIPKVVKKCLENTLDNGGIKDVKAIKKIAKIAPVAADIMETSKEVFDNAGGNNGDISDQSEELLHFLKEIIKYTAKVQNENSESGSVQVSEEDIAGIMISDEMKKPENIEKAKEITTNAINGAFDWSQWNRGNNYGKCAKWTLIALIVGIVIYAAYSYFWKTNENQRISICANCDRNVKKFIKAQNEGMKQLKSSYEFDKLSNEQKKLKLEYSYTLLLWLENIPNEDLPNSMTVHFPKLIKEAIISVQKLSDMTDEQKDKIFTKLGERITVETQLKNVDEWQKNLNKQLV